MVAWRRDRRSAGHAAAAAGIGRLYDRVKQGLRLVSDRPYVLPEAMMACRKGGTVSIAGVRVPVPMGARMNKALFASRKEGCMRVVFVP